MLAAGFNTHASEFVPGAQVFDEYEANAAPTVWRNFSMDKVNLNGQDPEDGALYGVRSVRSLMTYSYLHNDSPWEEGEGDFINPEKHICVPGRFTHRLRSTLKAVKAGGEPVPEGTDMPVLHNLGFLQGIQQFIIEYVPLPQNA